MRERILILVVLFCVSTVSALMLAAVNAASKDVIIKNRERNFKIALLTALNIEKSGKTAEELYSENIKEQTLPAGKVYLIADGGKNKAAAFQLTGPGFWGPISVMVGVTLPDYKITGFEILEEAETPGLGARIEEAEFREQFLSKNLDKAIIIKIKGEKPGPNDVSAITGASITSKSLEKIINEASKPFMRDLKELAHG